MASDAELSAKARRGDVQAFGELVERYKERAYMIALGFLGSPEDAMDLSQDAFVKAFRAIRTFKEGREFYPWFYAILRNSCFNYLRRAKVRKESSLDAAREYGFDAVDRSDDPAAYTEREEMKEIIRRELAELDPVHREILILRHFEYLTYKEMAEVLLCPIGTVMSRLYAARKALRGRLVPYLGESSSGDAPRRSQVGDEARRDCDGEVSGGR
jgi:RNA polymerase sigma-70 factor (ECF subfamily)